MYPSEYTYRDDSVNRFEGHNANCRNYPAGPSSQEQYIHCDGTQLRLTDSNLGQEEYRSSECYWWPAGSGRYLLFVFSKRVSLTTITLHYYSDSLRGLPRLRFFAAPDDYGVWDRLTTSHPYVEVAAVPADREPAGRRNISINVNFNTKKVLMYKYSSTFLFAVSEVQFFICRRK